MECLFEDGLECLFEGRGWNACLKAGDGMLA